MDNAWAMEAGLFFAAIPLWLVSLFYAWSYSSSPMHHILPKCLGWLLGFPMALAVGSSIGYALAPNWWQWAYTLYFGGYGFLLVWLAVAILGHDDFVDWAKDKATDKLAAQRDKKKTTTRQGFTAPDRGKR